MKFGIVRCFDCSREEGWITPQDGTRDIPVHQKAVKEAGVGQLAEGQTIGFYIDEQKGSAVDLWATWSNR